MQLVNQPPTDRARQDDVTHRLVQSIALELWRLYGRNGTLNWPGVERHLGHIVNQARNDVRDSLSILISVAAASHPPKRGVVRQGSAKRTLPSRTERKPRPPISPKSPIDPIEIANAPQTSLKNGPMGVP